MWPTYDWQQYRNKILSATPSRCSGRHKKRKCRCMHTLRSGRVCLSAVRQNHFTIFPSNILLFFGLCLGHFISFLSFRLFIMAFFSCGRTHIRIARTTSNATSSHYFQWQYFVDCFFFFLVFFFVWTLCRPPAYRSMNIRNVFCSDVVPNTNKNEFTFLTLFVLRYECVNCDQH